MATVAEVNAELDPAGTGLRAKIIFDQNATHDGATPLTRVCYCLGGTDRPGRSRWVTLTVADSAATQAAAVLTGLS